MADLKISQLTAAGALSGAELLELVQGGTNVRSTPGAIAALAPPAKLVTLMTATNSWGYAWHSRSQALASFGPINGMFGAVGITASNPISPVPAGITLGTSVGYEQYISTALINNAAQLSPLSQDQQAYRKCSGRSDTGGFVFVARVIMLAPRADQTFLVGLQGSGNTNLSVTAIPSALTNLVAFAKDQGDTNLQFMVNNGAGTATKTDLGVTFVSLLNHFMQVTITADAAGAVLSAQIQDLDGTLNQTITVLDGATKNPLVDVLLNPYFYSGTGTATGTAVQIGFHSAFFSTGLINS